MDNAVFQVIAGLRNAGAVSVMVTNGTGDARWGSAAGRSLRGSASKGWASQDGRDATFAPLLQVRTGSLERLVASAGVDVADGPFAEE